jgi:hypothetical protein
MTVEDAKYVLESLEAACELVSATPAAAGN